MLKLCFKIISQAVLLLALVACSSAPKKPEIVIDRTQKVSTPVLTEAEKTQYREAVGLLSSGQTEAAEMIFSSLIAKHPKLTGAYVNLGVISKQNGQVKDAKELFAKALEINPNFVDALLQQAILFREEGNFNQSEDLLRRAQAIDPKHPLVNFNLGVLYELYLQDYPRAIDHYKQYVAVSTADDVETVKRWILLLERK